MKLPGNFYIRRTRLLLYPSFPPAVPPFCRQKLQFRVAPKKSTAVATSLLSIFGFHFYSYRVIQFWIWAPRCILRSSKLVAWWGCYKRWRRSKFKEGEFWFSARIRTYLYRTLRCFGNLWQRIFRLTLKDTHHQVYSTLPRAWHVKKRAGWSQKSQRP